MSSIGIDLFHELKLTNQLPKHIEFARAGQGFFATVYNYLSGQAISQSVCTGYAATQELALEKALTEYIERKAYSEAYHSGYDWVTQSSTDGFAAFPIDRCASVAKSRARTNALHEAIERYAWATWWDDLEIAASVTRAWQPSSLPGLVSGLAEEIEKRLPPLRYYLIEPKMIDGHSVTTIIFAEIKGGGFLSGGACDSPSSKGSAIVRAMTELTRHALALVKLKRSILGPLTHYEQKLKFFGSGDGDSLVHDRLNKLGSVGIELPPLAVDFGIAHSFGHKVAVHRCLFERQPSFVAGSVDRLCL
jgi:hypothetical protein